MTSKLPPNQSRKATGHVGKNESRAHDWFHGIDELGACPDSVRRCGELEGIGGSGGRFGRVGGVQAVASLAVDRLRPWASLSMLWARQTRPHSLATLSSPRIRN